MVPFFTEYSKKFTSNKDAIMSSQENSLSQFIEISGMSKTSAQRVLEACNYNIEEAVNTILENGNEASSSDSSHIVTDPFASSSTPSENASLPAEEAEIRAPIPSKKEQLLMPRDDNFRCRKRPASQFTVCPLRNFEREAEIQEEQLRGLLERSNNGGESEVLSSTVPPPRLVETVVDSRLAKRSRLEDLYRPPIDLLFWGTFHAARQFATKQNRWLIVNLQDNLEFRSQVINRDMWTDKELRGLVKKFFVLWQVSNDNSEGLRFQTFYNVSDLPYICIIDPRTGERMFECTAIRPRNVFRQFDEFLSSKLYVLEQKSESTSSSSSVSSSAVASSSKSSASTTHSDIGKSTKSISNSSSLPTATELSEEDQLALAIKNSLSEVHNYTHVGPTENIDDDDDDDDDEDETFTANRLDNYEMYLGNKSDPITKLQLRLPNGERVNLEWPALTKLRAIKLYLKDHHADHVNVPYKLIAAFPRQDIFQLDDTLTLIDAKLHPTSILHLHQDD